MILRDLLNLITTRPAAAIDIVLPNQQLVPPHFHVTEVGLVRKDFIDCGGTIRAAAACVMQVWVANDCEHRLDTSKLSRILTMAGPLLQSTDLPVEVEYEDGRLSKYSLTAGELTPTGVRLTLGEKHTACLAPDRCGIELPQLACCGTGCC